MSSRKKQKGSHSRLLTVVGGQEGDIYIDVKDREFRLKQLKRECRDRKITSQKILKCKPPGSGVRQRRKNDASKAYTDH
jgi:hypothetical protein